jgi:hypothetical protein
VARERLGEGREMRMRRRGSGREEGSTAALLVMPPTPTGKKPHSIDTEFAFRD